MTSNASTSVENDKLRPMQSVTKTEFVVRCTLNAGGVALGIKTSMTSSAFS